MEDDGRETEETLVFPRSPDGTGPSGFGRFQAARPIGAGGMARVFRAVDPELDRPVAIKVMTGLVSGDPTLRRRFLVEARVTGQLEHPNIVPVHELGRTAAGEPFLCLKLVEGRSLDEVLRDLRRTSTPVRARRELLGHFLKICDAMAFAHSRGVVHRDLKPGNVMIGRFGEVLVMDWGLARVVDGQGDGIRLDAIDGPDQTRDGQVMGTPTYMSPEQAAGRNDEVGPASDVYALGALLYEMLTFEPPFAGDGWRAVLAEVVAGRLVAPSRRAPAADVPGELEATVLRAMARRPSGRYPTAEALEADVEAYLDGRLLAGIAYTARERAFKWLVRHRLAAGVAAAFLALGASFAALHARGLAETRRAAHAEREARLESEIDDARRRLVLPEDLGQPIPLDERGRLRDAPLDERFAAIREALTAIEDLLSLEGESTAIDGPALRAEHARICRLACRSALTAERFGDARYFADRGRLVGWTAEECQATRARIEESETVFRRATLLVEKSLSVLIGGRQNHSREQAELAVAAATPGTLVHRFVRHQQATILAQIGRLAEAIDIMDGLLAEHPEFHDLRRDRAILYARCDDPTRALEELEVVLARSKEARVRSEALVLRADLRLGTGDLDGVIADATEAAEWPENRPLALHQRAKARSRKGEYEAALADYERVLETNPYNGEVHLWYAATLAKVGRFDEALDSIARAEEFAPNTPEIAQARRQIETARDRRR